MVRAREDVDLSRAETSRNVLNRFADPDKSIRRGVRLEQVLIDEALDMKLPRHEPLPPRVEAEEPDVFMGLALRVPLLGRIRTSVANLDESGAPMAMVIMFGLLSSTALNMIVVPILYVRFGRPVTTAP